MPRFACPNCQTVMSAATNERGFIVICAGCRHKVRVPQGKSAAVSSASAHEKIEEEDAPEVDIEVVDGAGDDEVVETVDPETVDAEAPEPEVAGANAKPARSSSRPPKLSQESAPELEEFEDKPKKKKKKRKKSKVVAGTLGTIGGLLFLGIFLLIVTGKWVDIVWGPLQKFLQAQGIPEIVAIVVTGGIILVPASFFWVWLTKSTILDAMPDDLDFRPVKTAAFKDLDSEALDRLTAELEALGFEKLLDYTVKADIDLGNKGFARLFVHPEEQCFAEINQAFLNTGDAIPMRCMFMSFLEEGWSVLTTNRTASKETYLMRRPQAVWKSLPDVEAPDLLKELLKLRKKMTRALGVEVKDDVAAKAYFAQEKTANRQRKDAVRRRWALGIVIELWLFERNPKDQWLGAYAKVKGK